MLTFVNKYGNNIYSQNREDGVIAEILKRINPKVKTAVEFGAPSFTYCSNTAALHDAGWDVKMFDNNVHTDFRIQNAFITAENVNEKVGNPTVLSIDVDNDDYNIWKAYTGSPLLVIIEINSGVEPTVDMVPGERGASYKSMVELGLSKGYMLICHTGNLVFVLNKYSNLFTEIDRDPINNYSLFFNRSHL